MKLPFGLDDGSEILEKLSALMEKVDEKDKEAIAAIHEKMSQGIDSLKSGAEDGKEIVKNVMSEASNFLNKYKDDL